MSDLQRYLQGPDLVSQAIDGLTEEEMKKVVEEGKWTIYENVIHVVDADLVYAERIKRLIAEENPVFLPFDQDEWTKRLAYHNRDLNTYLELFRLTRKSIVSLLEEVDDSMWLKKGYKASEPITLEEIVEALIGHVQGHVNTIVRLKNKLGK